MKLKDGMILHDVGGEHVMVASEQIPFNGIVRNNGTANFILHCMLTETTEDEIVEAVLNKYDAPREKVVNDVRRLVQTLKEVGFLDE
ncbi:MAG: PqqD family protein [Pyramidobacter sp.]|nr:PqqD family protein [Pyramidobacter sp.]